MRPDSAGGSAAPHEQTRRRGGRGGQGRGATKPGSGPQPAERDDARGAQVRGIAQSHLAEPGPLLVILHAVQEQLGYVDPADVPVLADVLNLSVADVHGVVSFYHDFRSTPAPDHIVQVCRAEACQAVGGQGLFEHATRALGSRDDAQVSQVFCLGNCALGPSVMVDGRLLGRVEPGRLDAIASGWDA